MKSLLFVLLCIVTARGQSLSEEYPFWVVYAEKAIVNSTQTLNSLDYLRKDDLVTVNTSGNLALVHLSGFPIEFRGDTTFTASQLDNLIRVRTSKSFLGFPKPLIDLLFISTPEDLKRELSKFRWLPHQHHELEKFFPPTRLIDISNGLCIDWRASKTSEYKVVIRNFGGDEIASLNSFTSALTLDKKRIDSLVKDSVALIQILDIENKRFSNEYPLQRLNSSLPFPYSCDLDKPSFALQIALSIEFSEQPDLDGAEEYYILATKLSDREFYQKMLLNFKTRRKR